VKYEVDGKTDYMQLKFSDPPNGASIGSDFAGDVISIGKNAHDKGIKVGDAVAGYVHPRGNPENGCFQEYVTTRPESVWLIPKDKLSYEEAAPMGGIALSTAVQALYFRLQLPTPWAPAKEAFPILIWGGATAVGIYAIKLAKLSGLQVATTASPKNHELMKKLGADVVYDYRDPEASNLIKQWSEGELKHALDTVSENGSTRLCARAFGDQDGKIITLLAVPEGSGLTNVDVVLTAIPLALYPSNPDEFAKMSDWNRRLPEYASELNVVPLKKWDGGLDGVPSALEYMKAGNVRAQKIVFSFS